jgi:hypothetical protein
MLAALLCHATMFVSSAEFHHCLAAVQQHNWARMDRLGALEVLQEALTQAEGNEVSLHAHRGLRRLLGAPLSSSKMADRFRAITGRRLILPSAASNDRQTVVTRLPEDVDLPFSQSAPASPQLPSTAWYNGSDDDRSAEHSADDAAAKASVLPAIDSAKLQQLHHAQARHKSGKQRRYTWSGGGTWRTGPDGTERSEVLTIVLGHISDPP